MPKCPVCKTECGDATICPECGFKELTPTFLNKEEGEAWVENVVWPWRYRYWETLTEFRITERTLHQVYGTDKTVRIPFGIECIESDTEGHRCDFEGMDAIAFQEGRVFDPFSAEEIYLPASVRYIGEGIMPAAKIHLAPNSQFFDIENRCLIDRDSKTLLYCEHSDRSVTDLIIPNGIKKIGSNAFDYCHFESISIPDSVECIGKEAFSGCYRLQEVVLPPNIKAIDKMAFEGCQTIKELTIPNSIEYLGTGFCCERNIKNIRLKSNNAYYEIKNSCLIEKLTGRMLTICNRGLSRIEIPYGVTEICSYAFAGCTPETVTIPNSVIKIGASGALCATKKIVIPDSVISIGDFAISCPEIYLETRIDLSKGVEPNGWSHLWWAANGGMCKYYWGGTWHYNEHGEPVPND